VTGFAKYLLFVGVAYCVASRKNSYAKELSQPTADAFAHYVQLTEARIQNEVSDPRHFLYLDSLAEKDRNRDVPTSGADGRAVREMKEDPSEPPCRRRLQTAINCFGPKGRGGERYG